MYPTNNKRKYRLNNDDMNRVTSVIHDFLGIYIASFSTTGSIYKLILDIKDNNQNRNYLNMLGLDIGNVNHIKLIMEYIKPKIKVNNFYEATTIMGNEVVNANEKPKDSKDNDLFVAFVYKIPSLDIFRFLQNNNITSFINSEQEKEEIMNKNIYVKFDFRIIDKNLTSEMNKNNLISNPNFQNDYLVISRRVKTIKSTNHNQNNNNSGIHINVCPKYEVYQLYCISFHKDYDINEL